MNDTLFQLIELKAKGYCCSQIMMLLALEKLDRQNVDLVKALGGLCYGILGSGEVCGALSGGACLIALYAGKGSDDEEPHDQYLAMLVELVDWFKETAHQDYGGTRCDDILSKYPDRSICGLIVADTYQKCMEILSGHGFSVSANRDGRSLHDRNDSGRK